jgi:hypothetical protein
MTEQIVDKVKLSRSPDDLLRRLEEQVVHISGLHNSYKLRPLRRLRGDFHRLSRITEKAVRYVSKSITERTI